MMRQDRISSLSLILKTPTIISHMPTHIRRHSADSTGSSAAPRSLMTQNSSFKVPYQTHLGRKPSRQNKGRKTFHLELKRGGEETLTHFCFLTLLRLIISVNREFTAER